VILRQAGFAHVRNLAGGMLEWNARRLPVEH
jgi:rhodanese-related sulfurtransferase